MSIFIFNPTGNTSFPVGDVYSLFFEEYSMNSTPFVLREDTGCYKATRELSPTEILDMASFIAMQSFTPGKDISKVTDAISIIWQWIGSRKNEVFIALFLDNKHRIIRVEELFYGTIDSSSVHPRVVVQKALDVNAAALILGHNHPSGVVTASDADKQITSKLKEILAMVDIRVLDHVIVGPDESTHTSFVKEGYL